ncbi:MAG: 2-hydroxyacyl-CoA dehydratase family protein [Desulfobacterales bacterium]
MKKTLVNRLQQITEQNLADIEQAKAAGRSVIGFYCLYSPTEIAVAAEARKGALRSEDAHAASRKRILLTGLPVGLGSDKVVKIVEQSGADVVAFENCSGYKQAFTVDPEKDLLDALAAQYLATPCSVMSPNSGRFELLKAMIRSFAVDGVIDLTWQACHTYNVEAFRIAEFVQETCGLPSLHLETDYAESDSEQLRVRIEAYLEML